MSGPFGSSQWMYNAGGAFYPYSIDQSLRFNDNDSANLNRTPSTAGDRQVWTWSAWLKRSTLSTTQYLFVGGSNADNATYVRFFSNDKFQIFHYDSNSTTNNVQTEQVFRDVSSWYHIVLAVDTTQATSSDRVKIYVNGERVTNFTTATYPSLNFNYDINTTGSHRIGSNYSGSGTFFDGYMAEVHFVDGTQYAASDFGETINGIWVPKEVSGLTYGTNGFYLSFADSSAIGDDLSGNTNDFTATNLAASDVVPDSPTNNMAVLSTVSKYTNASSDDVREGGLEERGSSSGYAGTVTFDATDTDGYYYEVTHTGTPGAGCTHGMMNFTDSINQYGGVPGDSDRSGWWGVYRRGAGGSNQFWYYLDGVETATLGVAGAANDVWMYLIKDGKFYIGRNGTWFNSADPSAGTGFYASGLTGTDWTIFSGNGSNVTGGHKIRVDRNLWDYGDASYKEIKTSNIAEPTIGPNSATTSDEHFNTVLYTGTNPTSQSVTGVGFQPDFVWWKNRTDAAQHMLGDSVRGAGKVLSSDATNAELDSTSTYFSSFDSDGFTVTASNVTNGTSDAIVAWNWKAGGTAVSNTDGSITSSVSANPDAGFSIVGWTGNGVSGATIGHGLSSAPELIISKLRSTSGIWMTYAKYAVSDAETDYLRLDGTDSLADDSRIWNDTAPSATVFTVGSGTSHINVNGATQVTYCFHSVEGFSKVGKYVGNNSTDGPFSYTGFRPAFVIIKRTDSAAGWVLYDNKRDTYNQMQYVLWPNLTNAEYTSNLLHVDFLSNGFKVRNATYGETNASGGTYIYIAFAEAPFKYANAR